MNKSKILVNEPDVQHMFRIQGWFQWAYPWRSDTKRMHTQDDETKFNAKFYTDFFEKKYKISNE